MVYHELSRLSTHKHLDKCVDQENKWPMGYRERERYLTILYRAVENTEVNTINATYTRRMIGSLDVIPSNIQRHFCILAGCIFYGME